MEKIILFGASDHCRYTIDIIEQEKKYQILGIFDKKLEKNSFFEGYPVFGYLDELNGIIERENVHGGIVAVGDNYTRMTLVNNILTNCPNFNFVNAIHPSVIIGKESFFGSGLVIMAGVIINNNCIIGNHCFLATKASLDHDSIIGDYSSLSPGVTTGGRVDIGKCTAIGIGASILHYIKIGDNSVVGGNSLVNKDVEDNVVVYGVPIKIVKQRQSNDRYL